MTRKVSARRSHSPQPPRKRGGSTASASAPMHTAGVYHRAKRVMKFSALAFFMLEFSTRSKMRLTVDWPKGLVTSTRNRPVVLTQPLTTSSPSATSRGRLSPVRALVFRAETPSSTRPSSGTFSPGRTTMIWPGCTSSGLTVTTAPSFSRLALSGRMSIRAAMLRRLLPTA